MGAECTKDSIVLQPGVIQNKLVFTINIININASRFGKILEYSVMMCQSCDVLRCWSSGWYRRQNNFWKVGQWQNRVYYSHIDDKTWTIGGHSTRLDVIHSNLRSNPMRCQTLVKRPQSSFELQFCNLKKKSIGFFKKWKWCKNRGPLTRLNVHRSSFPVAACNLCTVTTLITPIDTRRRVDWEFIFQLEDVLSKNQPTLP